jgi:uncharacterized protein DUF1302
MNVKRVIRKPVILIGLGLFLLSCFIGTQSFAEKTKWHGYIDSATYVREEAGLSKARIAAQLEALKPLGNIGIFKGVSLNATFRVSYDGVYELNDDEFGDDAGGAIMLENKGGLIGAGPDQVPHGGGLINGDSIEAATGIVTNAFARPGDYALTNPNEGMVVLGDHLHKAEGGVTFGVPVRPCDEDPRGCISGYLDFEKDELAMPELFSERWDWLREFYIDGVVRVFGKLLNLRIGKQQVIWGRTDLFRVLDVINPVDYSRNNIYDELEDIRIPMWIFNAEYRFGPTLFMDDFNVQFIWNFDEFRPHDLGQGGTPNQILNAGSFFRGMKNLWDNGGTVSNFASVVDFSVAPPATVFEGGVLTTDFGPHQIGIRRANMPDWELSNTQVGVKVEGVLGDFGWSINGYHYRSQLPSLRAGRVETVNPFLGTSFPPDVFYPGHPGEDGIATRDHLIAFDIEFPRVNLIGGSVDYYSQIIDTVFRVELAYTEGEEFANTLSPRLFSESGVIRYVFGADKNIFIRPLNRRRAFLFSFQMFGQHLLDHEKQSTLRTGSTHALTGSPYGEAGMPDWEENWIATLLIKGWWMNDQLSPQIISAYDFRAHAAVVAPSVEWLISDHWKVNLGANVKFGRDYASSDFRVDDVRAVNPFPPFTTDSLGNVADSNSMGLAGLEPLGRFRAGPIGMAQEENEIQLTIQYRF